MTFSASRVFFAVALVLSTGWGQNAWAQSLQPNVGPANASGAEELDEDLWSALTPLDRQILEFVSDSQLDELLSGTDPSEIFLSNGETLSRLAERTQAESSRNLLFAPVVPCRLLDTRATPEGQLLPGETRGFRVRETDQGYAEQGGAEQGCGLPGLDGLTLRTNAIRAVALNVLTVEVGGPGSLAIWPANKSEPEIGSVSFAAALAGGGVTAGVLVPVCDEAGLDPCSAGDLKIKAKISGGHVVADVVGYFHSVEPGAIGIAEREKEPTDRIDEPAPRRDAASGRRAKPSSVILPESRGLNSRTSADTALSAKGQIPGPLPLGGEVAGEPLRLVAPSEIGLSAELASGHSADGTAIYAFLPNDVFSFNANAILGQATTGNAIKGLAPSGRAIYGQTEDGYAIYGFDGGSAPNRGYAGYFYSTNGIGVYGYSNGNRTHPNILAPGVYGQSNQGVGVYGRGDTSDSFSFYNEGGFFEGGKGLYARGTDPSGQQGYGARIFSSQYRGMYAQGASGWFDAYFGGDGGITTNGIVDRSTRSVVVANRGASAIEPGDLVAMLGVVPSPEGGQPMLAVAKVDGTNRHAVIGVAKSARSAEARLWEDGEEYVDFSPLEGAAPPDGYLDIVTDGLVPNVNLSGLSRGPAWQVGERIALSADATLGRAQGNADAVTIGRVAAPPNYQSGTVAVFVDID